MAVLYENGNIRSVQFGCKSTISRPTICTIGFSSQKIIEGTGSVVNSDHPSGHKPNDCGQGDLRLTREGGGGSGVVGSYTITAALQPRLSLRALVVNADSSRTRVV